MKVFHLRSVPGSKKYNDKKILNQSWNLFIVKIMLKIRYDNKYFDILHIKYRYFLPQNGDYYLSNKWTFNKISF